MVTSVWSFCHEAGICNSVTCNPAGVEPPPAAEMMLALEDQLVASL